MSYGIKIWNAAGTVKFDSTAHAGGVFVELLTIPYSSINSYKDYTDLDLSNRTLLLQQNDYGSHELSVSINSSIPRLSWYRKNNPFNYNTNVWVFAR